MWWSASRLKTKKWRKFEQHYIENHSTDIAQWVVQLTCIQEVTGLNPPGEQFFFPKMIMGSATDLHSGGHGFESTWWTEFFSQKWYFLHACFLTISLLLGIPSTHQNRTWAKLSARHLGTWICWLLMDICFSSSFTACWRHWCREKMGNSCH